MTRVMARWPVLLAGCCAAGPAVFLACTERVVLEPQASLDHDDGGANDRPAKDNRMADRPGDGNPCDEIRRTISYRAESPSVIVSLDRSMSMRTRFGDTTRLAAAQQGLKSIVKPYQETVLFGYEDFPGDQGKCGADGCCASPVEVFPGPNTASAIEHAMSCDGPGPGSMDGCAQTSDQSPSFDALRRCREVYDLLENIAGKSRYVLLITDGDPSCSSRTLNPSPCERAVAEVAKLATAGVKTLIVGVSDDVGSTTCLDRMAQAGGGPKTAAPYYFPASDPAALKQQLAAMLITITSQACHVTLRTSPSDPGKVAISYDGLPVPRDSAHREGWDFDAGSQTKITFYGNWCSRVMTSGDALEVTEPCANCPAAHGCK